MHCKRYEDHNAERSLHIYTIVCSYCAVGPGVECLQPDRNIYDTDCNLHNVHVGTAVNVCMLVC